MIQEMDLSAIITSFLLIATSDGPLQENDQNIINNFINKQYRSGNVIRREMSPDFIVKNAVGTLNTTNPHVRYGFFSALFGLDSSTQDEVVSLWNTLAGNSKTREEVSNALYTKVFIYHDFN